MLQVLSVQSDFTALEDAYYAIRKPSGPPKRPQLNTPATSASAYDYARSLEEYEAKELQHKQQLEAFQKEREMILALFMGKLKNSASPELPEQIFNRLYKEATHYSDGSITSIRECFFQLLDLIQYVSNSTTGGL